MELKLGLPNPKQKQFMLAKARYIAYGGARGGGKSWSVRTKSVLLCLRYAKIKILLLRKTYPELKENHVVPLRALLNGTANYKETDKVFTFPNGSRIKLGYLDCENDALQYQGQEYDIIFMDEATHFTEFMFNILKACLRGANNFPKRMYLTCNPGGIGHTWVKRLFIDKEYRQGENKTDYLFISATVYDNAVLMEQDPEYVKNLESLPEKLKQAWLYGNWNVFEGQYFDEFNKDIHVCSPLEIKSWWRIYTTMDYGLDMLAHYTIAIDEMDNVYVINELYESKLIVSEAIEKIKIITQGYDIVCRYAPPDLWNTQSSVGKSTADIFYEKGLSLDKANNDRISGWLAIKELLKVNEEKKARLNIFKNCTNLIRTLPQLQFDNNKPTDTAREPHEITHAPDALRYFANSITYAADKPKPKIAIIGEEDADNDYNDFFEGGL